ncbi:hypothetical protein EJB05_20823, partial [Eragrostis curvula]
PPSVVLYLVTEVQLTASEEEDRHVWRWTPDGQYTSKSAYEAMHHGSIKFHGANLIWKSWAPLKCTELFPNVQTS